MVRHPRDTLSLIARERQAIAREHRNQRNRRFVFSWLEFICCSIRPEPLRLIDQHSNKPPELVVLPFAIVEVEVINISTFGLQITTGISSIPSFVPIFGY